MKSFPASTEFTPDANDDLPSPEVLSAGVVHGMETSAAERHEDRHIIVSASPLVQSLLTQAKKAAASKLSVLIEGESGTGKELIARLIHTCSPRADRPYVRVNCAALTESLVESEFFGHEKGAFTGADEARPGRFELANTGTLLLDEISELPGRIQAKLLRVLEEEEFERVGGANSLHVDVRIIATTNRDLEREVAQGNFRRDLFYRLNMLHLRLPPLRERREDIAVLASHFFQRFQREAQNPLRAISARTLQVLAAYNWPGNVRQLRNAIQRACLLAAGPEIRPGDLPPLTETSLAEADVHGQTLAEMERHLILQTLQDVGGNKTAAAFRLGVTSRTLLNKLNKYHAAA